MAEIKELYAIEWMGPYDSLEEINKQEGSESCFIYLITGRLPYDREIGIKYVGISKRPVYKRLNDKDHQEKQQHIKDKRFWAGRFSVLSYNNLGTKRGRDRAELVEHLLVRYLSNLPGAKMINEKKTLTDPKRPIVIISRWYKKQSEEIRQKKPYTVEDLPDTLLYVDRGFYAGDKLRYILYTPQ